MSERPRNQLKDTPSCWGWTIWAIRIWSEVHVFKLMSSYWYWNKLITIKGYWSTKGFPGSSAGKESACNAGDPGSISRLGRPPKEGIGYPLQYSWASLVAQMVKNLRFFRLGRSPGEVYGNPLQYSCLENPNGQRSLAGYSLWDCKELDTTDNQTYYLKNGK